jgi:serine protease SohB
MKEAILSHTLDKKAFKKYSKEKKAAAEQQAARKNVYVMNFNGDIKASAVASMSEEINAILSVATPKDEVVLRLESPGGMVHGYGLASAHLMRFRARHIPLTVTVDKVAASGGYMMACVGNKILSAPFAITGSIGVIIQMPNFNRFLKDKNIDFEQMTAGEYKRTISLFGENTKHGKEKMQETIEDTHQLFKNFITSNRPQVDIQQVATGEHWFGEESIGLKLVDELKTSDDYLLELSQHANLFEIRFEIAKPLLAKLSGAAANIWHKLRLSA